MKSVSLAKGSGLSSLLTVFTEYKYPSISIKVQENDEVSIDIKISVEYGQNLPAAARQVQDVVKASLEKATDIVIKDVNVHVYGIERRPK